MTGLSWKEAAIEVLREQQGEAMHYVELAEEIAERGLVSSSGATPAATLCRILTGSIRDDHNSPFVKVSRGRYALRQDAPRGYEIKSAAAAADAAPPETGLINAFGIHWDRHQVRWQLRPKLLGRQPGASVLVDFFGQRGVYILYDRHKVVYVGRANKDSIGTRLRAHIADRFSGRWDRFSWFGVYRAMEDGMLDATARVRGEDVSMLVATMEALLIEALEPPQNRKRGDDLRAVEFWQVRDPDLKKDELLETARLLKRMRGINKGE